MELTQEIELPVSLPEVWRSLNDPEILKQSLTGCEAFNRVAENKFEIRLAAKVGPVRATFKGEVQLDDIKEMESYILRGSGKGGVAGFAKGEARVSLRQHDSEQQNEQQANQEQSKGKGKTTVLTYTVNAKVGGKLAQLGSRLVDAAAKKMADQFFEKFVAIVTEKAPG